MAVIFSRVLQQNSLHGEKICIILTGNSKDIFVVRLTVTRIMPLSVLIIEKHNSNFKRPSILIRWNFFFNDQYADMGLLGLFNIASRVSPNPAITPARHPRNSHRNKKNKERNEEI